MKRAVIEPREQSNRSLSRFPQHEAKYHHSPLDGMLVDPKVTPQHFIRLP